MVVSTVNAGSFELGFADAMALKLSADLKQQHSQHVSCIWQLELLEQSEGPQQTMPLSVRTITIARRTFDNLRIMGVLYHGAQNSG
jgi:hypothetical protein